MLAAAATSVLPSTPRKIEPVAKAKGVGFLEAQNSWAPGLLSRIEWDYPQYRDSHAPYLSMTPREYFRRNCWAAVEGSEPEIEATAGLIGALTSTVLIPDDPGEAVGWGIATSGFLAGLAVGDRALARAFDFTESEANLVRLGAIAGALMGFAIPAASETDNGRAALAFGSAGAILGALTSINMVSPRRSQER